MFRRGKLFRKMMLWVKTLDTITRQWILISRRGVFAVKPCLVPIFGVTRQASIGEDSTSSSLNRYTTEFQAGSARNLVLAVQIKIFPKEFDAWLLLKVYFAEDLKVADV